MTPDADLLVLGGGPVGLGTACFAARAGLSVAVIEQRTDPVDKACGEGVMPTGLGLLAGLDVDPPGWDLSGIRYLQAAGPRSAESRFRHGSGRGVRRTVLHDALGAAADATGVKRVSARPSQVTQHPDRVEVAGVTGRYLAAADGLHSTVSRQYGLDLPRRVRPRYGLRRHYTLQPWSDLVEVYWSDCAEAYVTPLGAEAVGVAVLTDRRGRSFDDWVTQMPRLLERLAGGRVASRTLGAGPLEHNVARRVVGRVLLVGDAAGYVDALTGEGITVGLAAGQELVASVVADRPEDYERRWRAASRRYRTLTRGLLFAAQHRHLRAAVLPAASRLPVVFGRVVDALA